MTTTAFDDQFTPATQTILRVNVIESQQQIHDLQTRLAAAIERADRAEAELAKLREQKPVAWRHENGNIFLPWQKDLITTSAVFSPLYAAPVHAPHKGATHCDDCGLTWLDDGLNPLGCPYCKNHASERNARRYLALRKVGVQVPGYEFVKFDWSLDAAADRLLEGGE